MMKSVLGLSLIEVMVSTFLTAVTVLAITGLKHSQENAMQTQLQFYNAWALLDFKLTDLRSIANSETEFLLLADDHGGALASGEVQQAQFIYQLSWRVSNMIDIPTALAVKKVTVSVTWKGANNVDISITDSTLLSVLTSEMNKRSTL